ncbi:transposase, partial [Gordonia tangerina]
CTGCALRARCTTSAKGRSVHLGEHHRLQRDHRKQFTNNMIQQSYRQHRPMVERSIAWLTRGSRRVPYRGVTANNNWLHHRAAAINLRRLITLGLSTTNNTWTLTTA